MATRDRRAMQDYTSFPAFGTAAVWGDIAANPSLSIEVLCQHMHKLGLVNPSEPTSADIAAVALVAQWGPSASALLAQADIDKAFSDVKALRNNLMYVQ